MIRRLPGEVRGLPLAVRVAAAVEGLPTRDRQVLVLLLVERLTPLEAAGALGLRAGEVERIAATALENVEQACRVPQATRGRRKSA